MRKLILASIIIFLFWAFNADLPAAWKPSGKVAPSKISTNKRLPGGSADPADAPDELEIYWQADAITSAIHIAAEEKKAIFIYFFFNKNKDDFPKNYDAKLKKYSEEQYIFAKVWVETTKDKNGKVLIADPANAEFFARNKLPLSLIGVALDPYGNIMDRLFPPMTLSKIMPFLDNAQKRCAQFQADMDKNDLKTDKLMEDLNAITGTDKENSRDRIIAELINALKDTAGSPYQGYEAVKKAKDKTNLLNERAIKEYSEILKDYTALDKEAQNPDRIVPEMEKIMKRYKGLPVEQEIKDIIKEIKDNKKAE